MHSGDLIRIALAMCAPRPVTRGSTLKSCDIIALLLEYKLKMDLQVFGVGLTFQ